MEYAFMLTGLAFFLFVIHMINRSDRVDYRRWLSEQREFGLDPDRTHYRVRPKK